MPGTSDNILYANITVLVLIIAWDKFMVCK